MTDKRCYLQYWWRIKESRVYHDQQGNPLYSLQYVCWSPHMGSAEQIEVEIPLSTDWDEALEIAEEYLKRRHGLSLTFIGIKEIWPCPYCDP